MFKKSTHFNAARRISTEGDRFRWVLIIGTLLASFSTIMNVGLWEKIPGIPLFIPTIVNLLGAAGGFLILYTTTFSDYKSKLELASKHESIGNDLNLIHKKIRNVEASFLDNLITGEILLDSLSSLTKQYITRCTNAPITKDEDFEKARENYEKGFTTEYMEAELNS